MDYTVKIDVRVFDERALWRAAYAHYEEENGTADQGHFMEICGNPDDKEGSTVDVGACLLMLFDPGVSPDGCEIQGSAAA